MPVFNMKDRVYLLTDPDKAEGTIVRIDYGRYYVRWDIGRTWIYAANQLVPCAVVVAA